MGLWNALQVHIKGGFLAWKVGIFKNFLSSNLFGFYFFFSIKAGRLLSHIPYQLYTKQPSVQKGLNFKSVCKSEDAVPGPSNIAKDLNRV